MVQTISARDISLYELEEKFNLQLATDINFFPEWTENLPTLTDGEKQAMARVKSNYLNLNKHRLMSEEAVKMVVLSPLLDLAGFYQPPFEIETETSVEISAEDESFIVKGNIDVLVIQKRFWVLVIESKSSKFDVMTALPQALAYMLDCPNPEQPTFGLLINGREFVFVKLIQQEHPWYARSYALSIERDSELHQVLSVLKRLGELIVIRNGLRPATIT
ncbi:MULTISPECIES: type I restriction endonuclease subunit R [unclassified Nostoc]|uniref:type I restriction endonuclease subunit R n=1 Tax=unclassified Nostoc TaxID=2593658 RepID=UPI002AD47C56|nr:MULTISPECIES: type I restriction endonuclease subunit R [unclassified Nostoc]MDZ8122519.1 type I restriction endonuclease subunit R [Nostoc sp. CmiVER01]MDZ8221666.1 type I restriction endonuclease subunit R [Nostoc sp. ChiVER01]